MCDLTVSAKKMVKAFELYYTLAIHEGFVASDHNKRKEDQAA